MMTYEVYRYVFIIGAILAGIMFCVSVVLFFALKIPTVVDGLKNKSDREKSKAYVPCENIQETNNVCLSATDKKTTKQPKRKKKNTTLVQEFQILGNCEAEVQNEWGPFEIEYSITLVHTDEIIY